MRGTLYSSNGSISYDIQTGEVIEISPDKDCFESFLKIVRIDVAEYRTFYHQPVPEVLDILSIGYWLEDGTYEMAESDWRNEEERARRDTGI